MPESGDTVLPNALPYTYTPGYAVVAYVCTMIGVAVSLLSVYPGGFFIASLEKMIAGPSTAEGSIATLFQLAAIRCVFAAVAVATWLWSYYDKTPVALKVIVWPESKMKGPYRWTFLGANRLSTFTLQSWTLLTIYFVGAALASTCVLMGWDITEMVGGRQADNILAVVLWLAYEVSLTSALLVTVVVTFVLIPGRLKAGDTPTVLFQPRSLIFHNANIFFMATELLLNNVPIVWNHFPFAMLFALYYGVFSWGWLWFKGVVYYPFADPTLPWRISIPVMTAICVALVFFFGLCVTVESRTADLHPAQRVALVYMLTASVMWTGLRGVPKPEGDIGEKKQNC